MSETTTTEATNGAKKILGTTKGRIEITDLGAASVLAMFFVQKLGRASQSQIAERLDAGGVDISPDLLEQALEAVRARGYLSYARGVVNGQHVRMYRPRLVIWANPPEVAQITHQFVADLTKTPEAEKLVGELNKAETEGAGTGKAREKMRYADYFTAAYTFEVLDCLLGGQPKSSHLAALVRRGPVAPEEADLRFPRDADGAPIIPASNIRGWLSGMMRFQNFTDSVVSYFGIEPARIEFKGSIGACTLPVIRDGKGCGLQTYERIGAGARFTLRLSVPERGFMDAASFAKFLFKHGPRPPRGLSNARSNEYGRVALVGYEVLDSFSRAGSETKPVLDDLPPEAQALGAALWGKPSGKDPGGKGGKGSRGKASKG